MEQPLFEKGQFIRCVDRKNQKSDMNGNSENDLVEGKKYKVLNSLVKRIGNRIYIEIDNSKFYQWQQQFVPDDFDKYVEDESHQALKGQKIVN